MPRLSWLLLFTALVAAEAHTSQVMLISLPLADLVDQSDAIVIAHPATPPTVTRTIDITPEGQAPNPQKWPPFVWTDLRYVVDEVLFEGNRFGVPLTADAPKLIKGATITVEGANTASTLWLHRSYYVEGMSESPIYESYRATGKTASPARVLFLRRHGGGFIEPVIGAQEWIEHRAEVVAAIAAPRPSAVAPTLTPTPPSTPTPSAPSTKSSKKP